MAAPLKTRTPFPHQSLRPGTPGPAAPADSTASRLVGLVQAMRPRQWIKNFACFAGLVFSGLLFQERAVLRALVAFGGFCLAASSVYLLNDVCDRHHDRRGDPRPVGDS